MESPTHVACPLCGGAVHAIAGRCKHCRADLVEARRARPPLASDDAPVAEPPRRRSWMMFVAIAVGGTAAAASSLWLAGSADAPRAPAAQIAPAPAAPGPRTAPAITSYRELLEAAIDAGCARLAGCGPTVTAPCEAARNALANPALTCTLDRAAAATCVTAIAKLPCGSLDPASWPDGIRKLPGCEAVCTP